MADFRGSKTDTLIKLVLVFFISLLSFTVGTFVGKQFSDSQHKFAMLESGQTDPVAQRSTASIPPTTTSMKPASALSDEDIARLADELEVEEAERQPQSEKAMAASEKMADEATQNVLESKPVQHKPKPMAQDRTVAKVLPQSVANNSVGKYTVQIASFGSEKEAVKHSTDLKTKGYSAFFVPAQVNGKTWYRVSVGLFSNRQEAANYRKKFLAETDVSSAIVQKIRR